MRGFKSVFIKGKHSSLNLIKLLAYCYVKGIDTKFMVLASFEE